VIISVLVELVTTAVVPLKDTVLFDAVVSKLDPTMVTVVPTAPPDGEKLDMLGDDVLPHPDRINSGSSTIRTLFLRNLQNVNMVFSFLSGTDFVN
jgi:hypothetical protein